jgi:hypothetical protein
MITLLRLIPQPFCRWQEVREGHNLLVFIYLFGFHVATLGGVK